MRLASHSARSEDYLMPNLRLCLSLLLSAVLLSPALGQPPQESGVLQYFDFENDTAPWVSLNPKAQVGLTAAQANVFAGTSSLEVKYVLEAVTAGTTGDQIMSGNIVLPLPGGIMGMKAVTLAFKASESLTAVVGGRERKGNSYMAPFFAPAGVWQKVALGLADFYPADDKQDPDAKFDPAKLEGLGVIDASGFLSSIIASGKLPVAQFPAGPRTFWLDEVKLLSTPRPPELGAQPSPDAVEIDRCDGETIRWIVLGGRDWQAAREVDQGARAGHYRFDYTAPAGTLVAWLKPIHRGQLAGTTALHLSACAVQNQPLAVSVEGKGKARYSTQVKLVAGDGWKRFDLPWSDFTPDQQAPAGAGELDPAEITSLTLADVTAMIGEAGEGKRSLWLQDVYATK
jgi:hypothetical protein